jgi:hypothetical protein
MMMFDKSRENKTNTSTAPSPASSSFFKASSPQIIQRQPQPAAALPQRGPNPSSCFTSICDSLAKPTSSCLADPRQCAQDFKKDVMTCLTANAPASNATNFSEILSNTASEIDNQIDYMNGLMPDLKKAEDKRQYIDWLHNFCLMKGREVWIEFNYNVVFENVQGQRPWVYYPNDWDEIDAALRAIPDEHLWGRSRSLPVLHFRRESFGPPSPTGSGQVGGETDASTGLIKIFNAGVGPSPYSRSQSIGVTATDQTIRHEVGHIVDATISRNDMDDFFQNIVQWTQHPMAWITPHAPPYPTWQAERKSACTELGFLDQKGNCDDTKMDSFFASLKSGNVTMNGRLYSQNANFLVSWPIGNVPSSTEFDYARTSQAEYFAELYAFAISTPAFLSASIPDAQVQWLKTHVFNTDALYKSILGPYKNLAINGNAGLMMQYQQLLNSADNMFTEQQLKGVAAKLNLLLNQMSVPQNNAAAV